MANRARTGAALLPECWEMLEPPPIVGSMPRRGQQARNSLRKARWATNETLESQAGSYRPPPGLSPSKQWEIAYDGANTVRVQFILWKAHGRVVNFVVNVQVITAEGWTSVERFDCCHGNCHLHPDGADSARVVLRLDSIDDVQRAFDKVRAEAEHRARIIRGKGE